MRLHWCVSLIVLVVACCAGCSHGSAKSSVGSERNSVVPETDTVTAMKPEAVDSIEAKMIRHGMVDLSAIGGVTLDIRYATDCNFAHRNLYGAYRKAYATPETARSLARAVEILREIDKSLGIVVFDAARPRSVQLAMWNSVKSSPHSRYVAKPFKGGPHNFGVALDVSLTRNGVEVDMGTPFDSFSDLSHIDRETQLVAQGLLSATAVDNRRLLRRAMTQAGFMTYSREWWHFERHRVGYARRYLQRFGV